MAQNTSRRGSPVFLHASVGCITLPFLHSVTLLTTVRRFLLITRLWRVHARCSSNSSRQETERYCSHVQAVSSTRFFSWPASHMSRSFLILLLIACAPVMWCARYRIIICKTMKCSAFFLQACTHRSLALSALTKRLSNLLPGELYRLSGIMEISCHCACHVTLSAIPQLSCPPSLVCTHSL